MTSDVGKVNYVLQGNKNKLLDYQLIFSITSKGQMAFEIKNLTKEWGKKSSILLDSPSVHVFLITHKKEWTNKEIYSLYKSMLTKV